MFYAVLIATLTMVPVATDQPPTDADISEIERENAELIKSQTIEKAFVIVKSTSQYKEARRVAERAARRLKLRLDLRGLVASPKGGLTFSKAECEAGAWDFPCYVARGRNDDGAYVSIEYSDAFAEFARGLYIVIVASGSRGDARIENTAKAARPAFPDLYTRITGVYMGCMH